MVAENDTGPFNVPCNTPCVKNELRSRLLLERLSRSEAFYVSLIILRRNILGWKFLLEK